MVRTKIFGGPLDVYLWNWRVQVSSTKTTTLGSDQTNTNTCRNAVCTAKLLQFLEI